MQLTPNVTRPAKLAIISSKQPNHETQFDTVFRGKLETFKTNRDKALLQWHELTAA